MVDKRLDPILNAYVSAQTAAEADAALETIVEVHLLPLARRIAGHRMQGWRSGAGHPLDRDEHDVVSDAMTTLVERIQTLRSQTGAAPVENLLNYAATVVHTSVAHVGRRRFPERSRLKNRLRYACSITPALSLSTNPDGDLVCGIAGPQSRERPDRNALWAAVARHETAWSDASPKRLAQMVEGVLRSLRSPVPFDMLVDAVAASARITEPQVVSADIEMPSQDDPADIVLDRTRRLQRLWQEMIQLPSAQRVALLLNLRDTTGAGLLWLIPMLGIATLRQTAVVLEMSFPDLVALWPQLPLNDAAIALRLGCTRQQVINLRMAARKRLANRSRDFAMPRRESRPGPDNLGLVSTSLEGT